MNKVGRHIILVGPIKPYKGGIAHFNDSILSTLRSRVQRVDVISWKRRYPSFLYPGSSQYDLKNKAIIADNPIFLLNIYNPLSWLKAGFLLRKGKPDIIVYNWVTPFLAPVLITLLLLQRKTSKSVLLCHNVLPHERRLIDVFLAKMVFRFIDKFIVHAEKELKILTDLRPNASVELGFHPKYDFFTKNRKEENIREKYGIQSQKKILLYFGYVRQYKGLKYLIEAMRPIRSQLDCHLLVVGEFWDGKESYIDIIERDGVSDAITIVDSYIPDDEVGNYFEQSDLIVLPYISATQSGIAQIAFSFDRPVITTRVGGLVDLDVGANLCIMIEPESSLAIEKAVLDFFTQESTEIDSSQSNFLAQTWEDYVDLIL